MDCACNFIKACKWDYSTKKFSRLIRTPDELNPFIPSGLEKLALDGSHVDQICEPGSIGIFYDCENRIPLAFRHLVEEIPLEALFLRIQVYNLKLNSTIELFPKMAICSHRVNFESL